MTIKVGVLALQGAFLEHVVLLRRAARHLAEHGQNGKIEEDFEFSEVRNVQQLSRCDALIIPGGESTTMSLVAAESNLLEPLRQFVK
jgi:5'-phosphate synthase pdxT subunit